MKRLIPIVGLALLWCSIAEANPIASNGFRARQAYETPHVQLSFFDMDDKEPTGLMRGDQVIEAVWQKNGITLNTGSGLTGLNASQFCDCDPGVGEHTYKVTFKAYNNEDQTMTASVTVVADKPTPDKLDAGVPATDLSPWDVPEPVEMQGLDCAEACAVVEKDIGVVDDGGPEPDKGVTPADSGPQDASVVKGEEDDSGCSVSGGQGGLVGLLALTLLGFVRRRG